MRHDPPPELQVRLLREQVNCLQSQLATEKEAREKAEKMADFGREWLDDSSLEKWFPFTAQELNDYRISKEKAEFTLEQCRESAKALGVEIDQLKIEKETAEARVKELEAEVKRLNGVIGNALL